jgi:hypothetical protein
MNDTIELPDWDEVNWDVFGGKRGNQPSPSSASQSPARKGYTDKSFRVMEAKNALLDKQSKQLTHEYNRNQWDFPSESESSSPPSHRKPPRQPIHSSSPPPRAPSRKQSHSWRPSPPPKEPPMHSSNHFEPSSETRHEISEHRMPTDRRPNNNESFSAKPMKEKDTYLPKSIIFEFRTLFLSSTEQLSVIVNFFQNILQSIDKENDYDHKNISAYLSSLTSLQSTKLNSNIIQEYQRKSPSSSELPLDEIILFDATYQTLSSLIINFFETLSQIIENKKNSYFQQLKKFKELSNQAISNMLSYERSEKQQLSLKYSHHYQQLLDKEKEKWQEERNELLMKQKMIEEELMKSKMQLEELMEKERQYPFKLQDSMKSTLKEQKTELEKEKSKLKDFYQAEIATLKDEMKSQLEMVRKTHDVSYPY